MVGINIILSVGNEYVKLAWEFTSKPWWENRDFLHLKKFEMTILNDSKNKKIVYTLKFSVSWKVSSEK
jgi:hypothetical protein